jgi:hypothetical protein
MQETAPPSGPLVYMLIDPRDGIIFESGDVMEVRARMCPGCKITARIT